MKSVQSQTTLDTTLQERIIQKLETALSSIHALQSVQIALGTEQLEEVALILQQALEMIGEITWQINSLLANLTNRRESELEFEGMFLNASNPFSQVLSSKTIQPKFKKNPSPTQQHRLLEVRTFKHLEIKLSGTPVRFPFSRCSELIVWLSLNGAASKDRICDELWNAQATRSNREYFRVVVRRSRNALIHTGQLEFNPIVFEQRRYQLSSQLELWVDAAEFAKALKNPDAQGLERALGLYRGEFMPYTTSEWANLKRTLMTDQALGAALKLAQSLERDEPRRAIEIYQDALEIEAFSEMATARLIHLFEQSGEFSAAQALRKAYQKMLE